MLYLRMSAEHLNKNIMDNVKPQKKQNAKVDINVLLEKVRQEKKKEKKDNIIFISLIASAVLVSGAIASF